MAPMTAVSPLRGQAVVGMNEKQGMNDEHIALSYARMGGRVSPRQCQCLLPV